MRLPETPRAASRPLLREEGAQHVVARRDRGDQETQVQVLPLPRQQALGRARPNASRRTPPLPTTAASTASRAARRSSASSRARSGRPTMITPAPGSPSGDRADEPDHRDRNLVSRGSGDRRQAQHHAARRRLLPRRVREARRRVEAAVDRLRAHLRGGPGSLGDARASSSRARCSRRSERRARSIEPARRSATRRARAPAPTSRATGRRPRAPSRRRRRDRPAWRASALAASRSCSRSSPTRCSSSASSQTPAYRFPVWRPRTNARYTAPGSIQKPSTIA